MKKLILIFSLFYSLSVSAQVVSGLYSGTLMNDSTHKKQTYELALSEYRGKVTGYSYTTFVVNDTFYYSIKRVKGTKKDNQLIVEDEKMIANNFPEAPAKGVHQINYIPLNGEDTLRQATGIWETTKTKQYYSIRGGVAMKLDNDSTHSALIGHLKELKIISTPNYASEPVTATTGSRKINSGNVSDRNNSKPLPQQPEKLPFTQRKNHLMQSLEVQSDSLVLSFYDNGVVDGDSISVYMNGKNIISNNKLTATATRKTISIKESGDEIQLLVVAENLGSIPPNTGLVVIMDGENRYSVNFTADMQSNAAIVIRKQKK